MTVSSARPTLLLLSKWLCNRFHSFHPLAQARPNSAVLSNTALGVGIINRARKNLRKATINFVVCPSVCPFAWNNSAPTGRIFIKFDIWAFFENPSRKFKLHQNMTRIAGTLHADQYTCLIIPRSFLLRIRNVSDKDCRGNQNTHFMFIIPHPHPRNSCRLMRK